jgi:glycosyltransferase involved in cell wall biosynthesis
MITVILPAYNEEEGISNVIGGIKELHLECEILVIDDASTDNTAGIASEAGARVIQHPYNKGNGASIKTGIREAKGDIIVMMDADGQHAPKDILSLVKDIGKYDMVVGARDKNSEGSSHRNIANKIYNLFATYLCGVKILDLTSGFRAVKKDIVKKFLYLFPNRFSYPTTITMSLIRAGYNVKYVPISASRRIGRSKINLLKDGVRFFIIMFRIATLFKPLKIFLPVSFFCILLGLGYYAYTFLALHRFTNMSLLLFVSGINIFLLGLISEQIAQLRFDRSEEQ